MNKIDIHTHILPERWPDFTKKYGYGGFIHIEHHAPCKAKLLKDDGSTFRVIEQNCWDPAIRVKDCDRDEVSIQVLSTVPVMFNYWAKSQDTLDISKFLNDFMVETVGKYPERLLGLATVPLQDPELAIRELERCKSHLHGVEIGSHVGAWNLDAPELFQFFKYCEKEQVPIFIHAWDMLAPERMEKHWFQWLIGMPTEMALAAGSLLFGGVIEKLPKLKIALGQGGGSLPAILGRLDHGFHARPDLCQTQTKQSPKKFHQTFFVDSLVHDPSVLRLTLETFGRDKVCIGSDYPFPLGESRPGELVESMKNELGNDTFEKISFKNALTWLGREKTALRKS